MFGSSGSVIGIVTLKDAKKEGIAFCIPAEDVSKAVDAANRVDLPGATRLSTQHNVVAATAKISKLGAGYLIIMSVYCDTWAKGIADGLGADRSVEIAQTACKDLLQSLTRASADDLNATVKKLATDKNVSEGVRLKLVDLWTNYSEIQTYVTSPKGSLSTYRQKRNDLVDKRKELITALQLLVGDEGLSDLE